MAVCIDECFVFAFISVDWPSRTCRDFNIKIGGTKYCKPVLALAFCQYIFSIHIEYFFPSLNSIFIFLIVKLKFGEKAAFDFPYLIRAPKKKKNYCTESNKLFYKQAFLYLLSKYIITMRLKCEVGSEKIQ